MAAPPELTIKNLTGKYVMNKSISDDTDSLLALQGISWFTRKAIGLATVVLSIKQYADKDGNLHVDIISDASGLTRSQENRTLDWQNRDHKDKIFGNVNGRSRVTTTASLEPQEPYSEDEVKFLQAKFLKDGKTPTTFESEDVIQSYAKNQDRGYGWTAEQTWGFEDISGKRYYTRRIVVRSADGKKSERARLVYDYQGKIDQAEDDALAYGDE